LALATAEWVVVDSNYETIAMSLSFQSDTTGWVGGGSASLQPLLLHTTNSGQNFTNSGLSDANNGAFLSIDVTSDGQTGVAGGLGFFGLPCGAYMNDGSTWSKTHQGADLICASQDAQAIDSQNLIIVGSWFELTDPNGDGLQVSTDGGQSWKSHNWNQGTIARYASFVSASTGFVTGGIWPEASSFSFSVRPFPHRFSRHLRTDGVSFSMAPRNEQLDDPTGYVGVIAMTTDGGQSFQTMQNLTGEGLYFNEISCVDEKNCWAAAEGTNKTTLQTEAWVYHTADGWTTYDIQLRVPDGSIIAMNMLNSTYGWCGGAVLPSSKLGDDGVEPDAQVEGAFWSTSDGGVTWNMSNELKNFYVSDISTVDGSTAYAAGLTNIGLSSLAKYTA